MAVRKFRSSWWVDFQIRHNRYRYRSPENTREGALAYEAFLRQKISRGERIEKKLLSAESAQTQPLLYVDFTEKWFETYVVPNNKRSTHRSKRNALDHHLIPFFGVKEIVMINVLAIEEFKALKLKDGLSPKTINNLLSVLRRSLTCAEEWELISKVPRVKWLRVPPPLNRFLSVEESERLLAGAENIFWHAFILCALRTGMRIGEICALDWSDINWERRTITVRRSVVEGVIDTPKNNRTRIIPMTDDLYALFERFRLVSGLIFPGPDGDHMRKSSWPWKALHRACKHAGLPRMGWHVLRHTFASQLTAQSVPLKATQMLLGHSTIQMTERYAHLAQSSLQSAVMVLPKASSEFVPGGRNVNRLSTTWQNVIVE